MSDAAFARTLDRLIAKHTLLRLFFWGVVGHLILLTAAFLADARHGGRWLERWWPGFERGLAGVELAAPELPLAGVYALALAAIVGALTAGALHRGGGRREEFAILLLLVLAPWAPAGAQLALGSAGVAWQLVSPALAWGAAFAAVGAVRLRA